MVERRTLRGRERLEIYQLNLSSLGVSKRNGVASCVHIDFFSNGSVGIGEREMAKDTRCLAFTYSVRWLLRQCSSNDLQNF